MTLETLFNNGEHVCSLHAAFKEEDAPVFILQKDAEGFLEAFLKGDDHFFVVVENTPPFPLLVALINAARKKGVTLIFLRQGAVRGDFSPLEIL